MEKHGKVVRRERDGKTMVTEISLLNPNGARISGRFEVSNGVLTVTASDGRTVASQIEEEMLSVKTLARMLLFQLHQAPRP